LIGTPLALCSAVASADAIFTFAPSVISAPDSRSFSNATGSGGTLTTSEPAPLASAPYNFLDTWLFTLAPAADVQAFVGSINFTSASNTVTLGIDNLQMNLLRLNSGGAEIVLVGWQSAVNFSGFQQLFSIAANAPFAAGDYALNVRGKLVGPSSAYAGTLQALNPVPLPTSAALFAGGLAAFGLRLRRRLRQVR
jgi:hypothetical protein